MKILITGCAGFIGFSLAKFLLARGDSVIGIDNLNNYYDVNLKKQRLTQLEQTGDFRFTKLDIVDHSSLSGFWNSQQFGTVVHLAAQAGVRYSITDPESYIQSNLTGFANILECCRRYHCKHLIYASSSSVYGANKRLPLAEDDTVDHPISLYAATKKSNELMAHSYASLFNFPVTGLRFFTVYGPWGRPDMALFKFTRGILNEEPIEVYNNGKMLRDFTYIDDIISGIALTIDNPATPDPEWDAHHPRSATSIAPYRLYNIGHGSPASLMRYIHVLEDCLQKKAIIHFKPKQSGEMLNTTADIQLMQSLYGYRPSVSIEDGIAHFIAWYRQYYSS